MKEKDNKDQKLQFRFSEDAIDRLDALKDKTHAATRAEVVRNSLRLYEYFIEQTEQGYKFQLVKDDERITIVPLSI